MRKRSWTLREHSPLNPLPPSLTYTNETPPIPLTTPCISIHLHLSHFPIIPLSSPPPSLTPISHHYHRSAPTILNTILCTNQPTLPLIHFRSDPLQLILFITPLDHHCLSLYPASHSYQPPLHSQTFPTLMSSPYLHTLYNFPCIPTLPFPIP